MGYPPIVGKKEIKSKFSPDVLKGREMHSQISRNIEIHTTKF